MLVFVNLFELKEIVSPIVKRELPESVKGKYTIYIISTDNLADEINPILESWNYPVKYSDTTDIDTVVTVYSKLVNQKVDYYLLINDKAIPVNRDDKFLLDFEFTLIHEITHIKQQINYFNNFGLEGYRKYHFTNRKFWQKMSHLLLEEFVAEHNAIKEWINNKMNEKVLEEKYRKNVEKYNYITKTIGTAIENLKNEINSGKQYTDEQITDKLTPIMNRISMTFGYFLAYSEIRVVNLSKEFQILFERLKDIELDTEKKLVTILDSIQLVLEKYYTDILNLEVIRDPYNREPKEFLLKIK